MNAHGRRTDPMSSHGAAEQMQLSGLARQQCDLALRFVTAYPGMTTLELARIPACPLDRYQLARRCADLEHQHRVRKGAIRKDVTTGRPSVTWWPIHEEPRAAA